MSRPNRPKSLSAILDDLRQRDLMTLAQRVAKEHHVLLEEMLGTDRSRPAIRARHAMWAELYAMGFWSYPRLAGLFAKDHTTIVLGVRAHRKRAAASSPVPVSA